jgi:hypothetical protein
MPDNTPNQVAIPPSKAIPDQLRAEFLQKNVQMEANLTTWQKRQLTKHLFQATFARLREQFRSSLEADHYRLEAQLALVKNKIDVEKDTIALKIREEYLNTLATIGMRVEMGQLEFMAEFGVNVESFRERLKAKNLGSRERERILQMTDNSFDRVYDRLMSLTDRLAPVASNA